MTFHFTGDLPQRPKSKTEEIFYMFYSVSSTELRRLQFTLNYRVNRVE
jgi:hypothetical protein